MAWDERMKDFHARRAKARGMGGPERLARRRAAGALNARERVERLLRDTLTKGERHLQRDAMILVAHAREGRDLFVSNDTKAIGHQGSERRARSLSEFGIRAMTLVEFRDYCGTLQAG